MRKNDYFGSERVAVRENDALTWLLTDQQGSTVATANESGTLQSEMRYTAFGETRTTSGTTPTDYLYTGQRNESSMGLYYYGARWYDPYLNRWTQPDTIVPGDDSVYTPLIVNYSNLQFLEKSNRENRELIGNPQYKPAPAPTTPLAYDRYAYGLNNPISNNDPSGYCIWDLCILEGIGLVEIILFGTAATATAVMITPGMPEAFAQSVVDLAEQAGQQVEQSIQALSNLGNRAIIRQRDLLPKSGDFPYVAPKQKGNPAAVPVRGGGFKDKAGNIWRRDKSRHGGEHWDVQLPSGKHLNVDDKGKITGGSAE